ncbi:DinB family protein [Herminiimonas arsenitoxidans]|uniref:DinB family protein n=1 Tax=Herminiimonas arsenitoxidans TaxID=1809410 RepID=UPI0009709B96|nr:DinB family protein [Herminiimonas arsenitoxidans]
MITPDYAQLLVRYNRWMNEKVYAASEQLSDEDRKADRGAFFKSIHSTLNHLVWGDSMWLGRFTKGTALERPMPTTPGGVDVHSDWNELKAARNALDEALIVWATHLDAAWLAQDFSWYSGMTKSVHNGPAWHSVVHMFNHQTHHRGQVTTLLSQQRIDVGATDLMIMPKN